MSLTINAKTYTLDTNWSANAVGYVGTAKTISVKDDVRLLRTLPKPTATFSGVSRSASKLTRTLTLTGALTAVSDMIVEISVSVPVGAASADIDTALNDMGAFLASASYKSHVKSQQISF